ncbi:uncharacterized protein LOC129740391 isoform X2 [Uranotaenia lowii]|uniref:uncharacterized protein LOC129740391 isoform X2 n=1 Tax=Uranotaenia lowii TaxID=190385 RepID=UPI00247B2157|nr:uncharacterized protein LOC129740391 isoform X2 [Uranotaenia lowii]
MAEHLLQRFANMASGGNSNSTTGPPSSMATISQRIHHEPYVKYPVYGPGTGPDIYEDGAGDYWQGESGPGFFAGGPGGPPLPPPPPPPPAPFFPPFRGPYAKFGKARFKGASVAILVFIGFLFFLSVLQNYIKDYSTTSSPMVIVLSSAATKDNVGAQYPFLQKNVDSLNSLEEEELGTGGFGSYKKSSLLSSSSSSSQHHHHRNHHHGGNKRPKGSQKRHSTGTGSGSDAVSMPPPPSLFSDLISVEGRE